METGHIFGGDSGFLYVGNYSINGNDFKGEVEIKRHSNDMESLIPGLDNWKMKFQGKILSHDSINLSGMSDSPISSIHEQPISIEIECRRILDLP